MLVVGRVEKSGWKTQSVLIGGREGQESPKKGTDKRKGSSSGSEGMVGGKKLKVKRNEKFRR